MILYNLAYNVYKEIKRHRNRKILNLYRLSCSILFDKWSLLYSVLFVALTILFIILTVLFIHQMITQHLFSLSYSSNAFYMANVLLFFCLFHKRYRSNPPSC